MCKLFCSFFAYSFSVGRIHKRPGNAVFSTAISYYSKWSKERAVASQTKSNQPLVFVSFTLAKQKSCFYRVSQQVFVNACKKSTILIVKEWNGNLWHSVTWVKLRKWSWVRVQTFVGSFGFHSHTSQWHFNITKQWHAFPGVPISDKMCTKLYYPKNVQKIWDLHTGRLNYLKDSASKTETENGWVFHPWVCRYQNGQEVKNLPRESSQSSQNSHQESAKIARWRNFAKTLNQKLFSIKFCVENWYHTLHSNHAVQSSTDWKSGVFDDFWDFWNDHTLVCVIRMKRVIPIFHTEFDALKVSYNRLGEIPPYGDFGDFWWLLWLLTG